MKKIICVLCLILVFLMFPACSGETGDMVIITMDATDFVGIDYEEAESILQGMGFTQFKYETTKTQDESQSGIIYSVKITEFIFGNSTFVEGDEFFPDATVTLYYYKYEGPSKPTPVYYSTNDYETAKKGNTGVFSYRQRFSSYDIYWIIDFDAGYVYYFGTNDTGCDRVEIVSGTLNDSVTITYHDSGDSYNLHFKYVNHPETLIVTGPGVNSECSTTDLENALELRDTMNIKDK